MPKLQKNKLNISDDIASETAASSNTNRRSLLKSVAWSTPLVMVVGLPIHAQATTTALCPILPGLYCGLHESNRFTVPYTIDVMADGTINVDVDSGVLTGSGNVPSPGGGTVEIKTGLGLIIFDVTVGCEQSIVATSTYTIDGIRTSETDTNTLGLCPP